MTSKAVWYGGLCVGLTFVLVLARAHAAPQTEALLSEIAAALSNNEPRKAEQLATAGLNEQGLSELERARLLLDRGLAYEQQGAHGYAATDLTQAIELHALPPPEQTMALFERGLSLDSQGRLADALGDYDGAVRLSANSAPALNNRANALRRLGRLDEAKRDYLASIAAGNDQPQYPYYGLGQVAEAQGDSNAARGLYAKALAASPGYRLAAERLDALGGPREGSVADDSVIRLHPPSSLAKSASDTVPGATKPLPAVPALASLPPGPARTGAGAARQVALRASEPVPGASGGAALPLRRAIVGEGHGAQAAQLGAWRLQAEAQDAWNRAMKRAGDDLAGLTPQIVAVDLPGRGRYFRLRVSPDAGTARFCASLTAKGLDCLPVWD